MVPSAGANILWDWEKFLDACEHATGPSDEWLPDPGEAPAANLLQDETAFHQADDDSTKQRVNDLASGLLNETQLGMPFRLTFSAQALHVHTPSINLLLPENFDAILTRSVKKISCSSLSPENNARSSQISSDAQIEDFVNPCTKIPEDTTPSSQHDEQHEIGIKKKKVPWKILYRSDPQQFVKEVDELYKQRIIKGHNTSQKLSDEEIMHNKRIQAAIQRAKKVAKGWSDDAIESTLQQNQNPEDTAHPSNSNDHNISGKKTQTGIYRSRA